MENIKLFKSQRPLVFGKHHGKTCDQLFKEGNLSYIQWYASKWHNLAELREGVIGKNAATCKYWLEFNLAGEKKAS